jgi:hypothetical protein
VRFSAIAIALSTLGAISWPSIAHGGDESWVASEVVTSYVSGTSPTLILSFDNNLEICLALRHPGTADELREQGIAVTRSQLLVLRLWGLIDSSDDGALRFRLPVIDESRSFELAERSRILAAKTLSASWQEIDAFTQAVRDAGWARSNYALLGSYVLDGLMWPALEQEGLLESADPTTFESGSEYWSGVSWVTLPPERKAIGTNSVVTERGTLHAAWTPISLEAQELLWQDEEFRAIIDCATGQTEAGSDEEEMLKELGFVDRRGRVRFPVIEPGSAVCEQGGILARRIAKMLGDMSELGKMMELAGDDDPSTAMIIAYHWVYPALLRILEAEGLSRPAIFDDGSASGLASSVFVTLPGVECVEVVE